MAFSPDTLSASSSQTSLYCSEDVASWGADDDTTPAAEGWSPPSQPGRPVAALLSAEAAFLPSGDYLPRLLSRSLDPTARQDAVTWILKVNEFYGFRPETACLAVSCLDRFLSARTLPAGGAGWAMQLLSVACVSVAAKMEETHVPLLLDLQILDPKYVFEPRTVRRMELLLMGALRWRIRSVTPFDFLEPFSAAAAADRRPAILSRAASLVLSSHRVVEFLGFHPSAIAASAVLCAAGEVADDDDLLASGIHECLAKDVVMRCRQLMEESLVDTCPVARGVKRGRVTLPPPPPPQSPVGVLDAAACGSCDSYKSAAVDEAVGADQPPPARKRCRVGGGKCTCTASIDTAPNE